MGVGGYTDVLVLGGFNTGDSGQTWDGEPTEEWLDGNTFCVSLSLNRWLHPEPSVSDAETSQESLAFLATS